MKYFRKKIATVMTAAVIVASMAVSASAVSVSTGNLCAESSVLSNFGAFCPDTNGTDCLKELDINKLLGSLDSGSEACPQTGNVSDASDETSGSTTVTCPQTNSNTANQNSNCGTADTSVKAAESPAAVTNNAASENSACTSAPACTTSPSCTTGNCVTAAGKCNVSCDIGATCAGGNTLYDRLNGIFTKCGIDLTSFGISLSGCGDTAVTETPLPSENTDAETPATDDGTAAAPADNGSIENLSFEQQVASLVNEQRAANGLAPLTLSEKLSNVARAKSQDMHDNNYFSHTSPTYGSPFDMLKSFGISYSAAGENIAMGYSTPEAVVNAWMNSAGHRANILSASYTQIGVGYVSDGNYWTQEFIG